MGQSDERVTHETGSRRSLKVRAEQEAQRFERAMAYCREHFRTARLEDTATHVGLSPFHFCRWFSRMAGRTFKTVLTEMQMEHARALLLDGVRLPEVAQRCGFAHQSHLASRFYMSHGLTPSRWLRRKRRDGADADVRPPLGEVQAKARAAA